MSRLKDTYEEMLKWSQGKFMRCLKRSMRYFTIILLLLITIKFITLYINFLKNIYLRRIVVKRKRKRE